MQNFTYDELKQLSTRASKKGLSAKVRNEYERILKGANAPLLCNIDTKDFNALGAFLTDLLAPKTEASNKSTQQLVDALVAAANALGDHVKANEESNPDVAMLLFAATGESVHISGAGTPADLVKLVARGMVGDKNIDRIIESAVEAAPMVGLMDMLGDVGKDSGVCPCPRCTAARAKAN